MRKTTKRSGITTCPDNFSRFTTDSRNTPSSDRDTVCTQKSPRRRSSPDNLDSREEARQQSKGKRKGRQNDPIPNRRNDLPGNFCPDQLQNAIGSKRPRTKVSRQEFVEPSGAPHSPCHEQIAQYLSSKNNTNRNRPACLLQQAQKNGKESSRLLSAFGGYPPKLLTQT